MLDDDEEVMRVLYIRLMKLHRAVIARITSTLVKSGPV